MAAAAGLIPGADIRALPALDTIGSAPRDKQVDAVVATILNGMVSSDTRAVLLSGEHPMLAGSGKREAGSGVQDTGSGKGEEGSGAMDDGMRDGGWRNGASLLSTPASRFPLPASRPPPRQHPPTNRRPADRRTRAGLAGVSEALGDNMERRAFVKSGALALVTMGLSPSFLRRTAFGMDLFKRNRREKSLSASSSAAPLMRSTIVVPHGERAYYAMRPSIAIPQPSMNAVGGAIDLDGFFGLHLHSHRSSLYTIESCSRPCTPSGVRALPRSHVDAQDSWRPALPDNKGTADGWLNRYPLPRREGTCDECNLGKTPFRAVSMTPQTPRILEGPSATVAMNSLDEFSVRATGSSAERLEALYRTGSADLVHGTGAEMFRCGKDAPLGEPAEIFAAKRRRVPRSQFGLRLLRSRRLVKANVGLENRLRRCRRLGPPTSTRARPPASWHSASTILLEIHRRARQPTSATGWTTS